MRTGNRTVLLLCSVYHTNHKMSSTSDLRIESEGSELKLPETATAEQLESDERGLKIQSSARITPLTCRQGKGPQGDFNRNGHPSRTTVLCARH